MLQEPGVPAENMPGRPRLYSLYSSAIIESTYTSDGQRSTFLNDRQQRVKLGSSLSDWTWITGGMPQVSWLIRQADVVGRLKLYCCPSFFPYF